MVVNLSDVISGYNSAVVSLSSLPPKTDGQVGASNITTAYFSVYVAVWDPSYTPIELSYNQTPIVLQETTDSQPTFDTKATYVYYDQQAEAERDALIDYGARLRKFRYDVGGLIEGTTFNPGPAQIDLLPLDAADSMVRGSLPGVAFPYSFFNLPAAASTIVANAVSFFS
jgi:hypothetical protein